MRLITTVSYSRPAVAFWANLRLILAISANLSINMTTKERADLDNLSEHLDSPIVDLEWGQPIFYEGR